MKGFRTDFVTETEKAEWRVLFNGYEDFYRLFMNDEIAERIWNWVVDPNHVL
jgi:hypothetical protein